MEDRGLWKIGKERPINYSVGINKIIVWNLIPILEKMSTRVFLGVSKEEK